VVKFFKKLHKNKLLYKKVKMIFMLIGLTTRRWRHMQKRSPLDVAHK